VSTGVLEVRDSQHFKAPDQCLIVGENGKVASCRDGGNQYVNSSALDAMTQAEIEVMGGFDVVARQYFFIEKWRECLLGPEKLRVVANAGKNFLTDDPNDGDATTCQRFLELNEQTLLIAGESSSGTSSERQ
jgi:hypothetical protein